MRIVYREVFRTLVANSILFQNRRVPQIYVERGYYGISTKNMFDKKMNTLGLENALAYCFQLENVTDINF